MISEMIAITTDSIFKIDSLCDELQRQIDSESISESKKKWNRQTKRALEKALQIHYDTINRIHKHMKIDDESSDSSISSSSSLLL